MVIRYVFVIALITLTSGCGYTDYGDCVIGEMKGQDIRMKSTVNQYCERRHPYERRISVSHPDFSWSTPSSSSDTVKITLKQTDEQYRITRVDFKFTEEECGEVSREVRRLILKPVSFSFADSNSSSRTIKGASEFKCVFWDQAYGKLKS